MEQKDIFDKKEIYKTKIQPIIDQLYEVCSENELPMFTAVCVANNEEKTEYEYEALLAALQLDLYDNKISKLMFSFNGFDVDAPHNVKTAIRTLQQYISRIDKKKELGIKLKDDQINTFTRVMHHADVSIPRDILGDTLEVDDDFF